MFLQKLKNMKYYLIKVKLGHVGRQQYLPMALPIKANNIHEAIKKARNHGGVKRNHKDWCLEIPVEIDLSQYQEQKKLVYENHYWQGMANQMAGNFSSEMVQEKFTQYEYKYYKKLKYKEGRRKTYFNEKLKKAFRIDYTDCIRQALILE